MSGLNLNKMKEILKSKNMTYDELSQETGISKSTISKIFGGFNNNPSIESLQKIANALECGIDDFIEYEIEPTSPYYHDRKAAELAQKIHDNPNLKILFDASQNLSPDDIHAIVEIAKRIQSAKR